MRCPKPAPIALAAKNHWEQSQRLFSISFVLQLDGIQKRFGRKVVLSDLSLHLRPEEIYGLLGPNGAGKSTTLRIITGLVRPDAGRILIDGLDSAVDRMGALRRVGAQIEGPAFYAHLSGRRNLRLLANIQEIPESQADDLLAEVGLGDAAEEKVRGYSTGMLQRLGIAAALQGHPTFLILDEPTAGLDPEGRESILQLIRRLAGQRRSTVLFTSHLFDEVARLCHRVGVLHGGRLAYEGPVADAGTLRKIYFSHTGPGERKS